MIETQLLKIRIKKETMKITNVQIKNQVGIKNYVVSPLFEG